MDTDIPKPYLPVESTFDRIVQKAGGQRITARLKGSPAPDNADYVFDSPQVIAELKELHYDANEDAALRERISDIYSKYMAQGKVPNLSGPKKIRIDLLPEECRLEMMTPFKRKLEGPVKKAARQIKESKALLRMPDAMGLLVLVNEASTFLTPSIAFHFLHHILNGQYRSVDHVVFCTVNMLLRGPSVPEGGLFWSSATVKDRPELPDEFGARLQSAWKQVIDDEIGVPGYDHILKGDVGVNGLSFEPAPAGKDSVLFVRPRRFYECGTTGFKYFCDKIDGGTATLYLVESYQHGKLIQAEFTQKLVRATAHTYREVTDVAEIKRLKAVVKKLRKRR